MDSGTTKIELTDPKEIEQYIQFCKYRQEWINEQANWKQVKAFAEKIQFGSFTLTIKDSMPVRIDRAMQQVVLGFLTKVI